MKMKWNRFLALALAVIMVIGMVPVSARAATTVTLNGGFNSWNGTAMTAEDATTFSCTVELAAGSYEFKIVEDGTWYGNNGTIIDTTRTTAEAGWDMDTNAGNCKLTATGGEYTFVYNTSTKKLKVLTNEKTLYFKNTSNWETVNAYYWVSGSNCVYNWPGKVMTDLGNGLWSITFPATCGNIIFNDGSNQTADLTVPTDSKDCYDYSANKWVCRHAGGTTTYTNAATCTVDGYSVEKCGACDEEVGDRTTIPAGHTYENGFCTGCNRPEYIYVTFSDIENLTVALYDEEYVGITTETERVTNKTFGESYIKVKLPSEAAYILATWYYSNSTQMTEITAGNNMFEVSSDSYPNLNGTWGTYCAHAVCEEETSDANCTDDGSTTYTCRNESCKKTITVTIPAKGHNFADGNCSVCGIPQVIYVDCGDYGPDHYYDFSYFINDGLSINTGDKEPVRDSVYMITLEANAKTIQFEASASYVGGNWYKSTEFDIAECTTEGKNLFTVTGAEDKTLNGEWGKYCAHANTEDKIVAAATCTANGSYDVHCNDCGKDIKTGVVINYLGHDWTDSDTCKRDGCGVPHYVYIDCGDYAPNDIEKFNVDVYRTYGTYGNYESAETVQVGDTTVYKVTITKETRYLELQYIPYQYSSSYNANVEFDPNGKILYQITGTDSQYLTGNWIECPHTYGTTEEVTLEATCITPGSKINKCAVCGVQMGDPVTIPATNEHVYGLDGKCTADPKCEAYDGLIRNVDQLRTALAENGEYKLGADIEVDSIVQTGSGVGLALDLNGHNIGGSSYIWVASSTLNLTNSGEAATAADIRCGGASTVVIGENVTVSKLAPGAGNVITNNGTIGELYITVDEYFETFDCTIQGTYGNVTISDDDYKVVETDVEDGKKLTIAKKVYVAQIGENRFASLADAVTYANATAEVDTIQLLADIVTESPITIDTPVKLELDDYSITREGTAADSVTVYVTSGGVEILHGSIVNTGRGVGLRIAAGGSVFVCDANVTGADYGIYLAGGETSDASANVQVFSQSGISTVTSANIGIAATGCSSVNVSDANVSGRNVGIYADGEAMLNINSGTVKGTPVSESETGDGIRAYGNASVNVIGGTVSGSASGTGIELYQSAKAWVYGYNGGTATVNGESGICVYGGSLTVEEGAAINGNDVAICTGSDMADESTNDEYIKSVSITITGGKFTGGNGVIETRTLPEDSTLTDTTSVSGGTFSHPVEKEYCAQNYVPVMNINGTYGVALGDDTLFDLSGATMTLGNSLAINFVIDTAKLDGDNHQAVIVKEYADGTNRSIPIPQEAWEVYDAEEKLYYFTYSDVAAKEMTDNLYVTVYDSEGNAVTNLWKDSVRDYCMRAIKAEEANNNNTEKLALYVDMLNYGAAAQTYFNGYHADDLANSQLTDDQKAFATDDVTFVNNQVKPDSGYIGSTLLLENNILFNFVFSNDVVASKAVITYINHYNKAKTVTVESADFQTYSDHQGNTGWYLSVTDMAVADGCQVEGRDFLMTCKLYDANGAEILTVQDSVASYLARAYGDSSMPLYPVVMKFATSAYNYLH